MRFLLTSPLIGHLRSARPSCWLVVGSLLVALLGLASPATAAIPPTSGPALRQVQVGPGPSPADPVPAPAAGPAVRYFAETGHTLARGFRDYWQQQHGATVFGLPLTEEFTEHYTDGSNQTVQYFERAVLEYDPAAPPGQQITPRPVGALLLAGQQFAPPARQTGQVFPATGFAVGGEFLRFWRDMNGAALFGNPLSPPMSEGGRTVQYFERARFESHPEFSGAAYALALAPAGYAALEAAGYALPLGALVQLEPTSVAEGHTLLVRATLPPGGRVSGTLDSQPLAFVRAAPSSVAGQTNNESRAVAGVKAMGAIGAHRLTLTITDPQGHSRTITRTVQVTAWSFPTERLALDDETSTLLAPAIVNAELDQINAIFAQRSPVPLWSGAFRLPLAGTIQVTAPFGERRAYNGGPVNTFHAGADLHAASGTPVRASAAGRVVLAQRLQVRGNCVIIDHGLGVYTMYAHFSALRVHVGDTVRAGQVIGLSGNTGLSTGPHLHWELHVSGPAVSPFEWTQRAFP